MREYRLNMSMWGLSKHAYMEMKYFCLQYPEKKAEAKALLGVRSSSHITEYRDEHGQMAGTVLPRGNATSNPVEDTMMKRLRLLEDCDLIDRVAGETDGGAWKEALILNCCYGKGYNYIDPAILPTSNRNAFFQARREFFFRLNNERIFSHRVE